MAEYGMMCDPSELDRLIHSYQCENEQILKLIEIENQHNEAIEKDIEAKKELIAQLEISNSKLDEETRRAHTQFTINRDNCESLKKTIELMKEHEEALVKKLSMEKMTNHTEKLERDSILQHYTDIWRDYEAKYESFPLAKELRQKQAEMEELKKRVENLEGRKNQLLCQITEAKGSKESNDFQKYCIQIAQIKVKTERKKKEIRKSLEEKLQIERKIKTITEEKAKEKEIEAQRKLAENAAMECNEDTQNCAQHSDDVDIADNCDTESMMISVYSDKEEQETTKEQSHIEGSYSHTVTADTGQTQIITSQPLDQHKHQHSESPPDRRSHQPMESTPSQAKHQVPSFLPQVPVIQKVPSSTAERKPQLRQGYFKVPGSLPVGQPQDPSHIRSSVLQNVQQERKTVVNTPVLCKMPSLASPQISQQAATRLGSPQHFIQPRAQINTCIRPTSHVSQAVEAQQIRVSHPQTLLMGKPTSQRTTATIPQGSTVQNPNYPKLSGLQTSAQGLQQRPKVICSPRIQPGPKQSVQGLSFVRQSLTTAVNQSPMVSSSNLSLAVGSSSAEPKKTPQVTAQVCGTTSPNTKQSSNKTPEMQRKTPQATTPDEHNMECDSGSPFSFEMHQNKLKELHKSPVTIRFEGRPMFDSSKTASMEESSDEDTGPFSMLSSSSYFKNFSRSQDAGDFMKEDHTSGLKDQKTKADQSNKAKSVSPKESEDLNLSMQNTEQGSKGKDTIAMQSLLGDSGNPESDNSVQETSFIMNFSGADTNISSPPISASFSTAGASSFTSLFGSQAQGSNSPSLSTGFSMNFGGTDTTSEFSTSFGRKGDNSGVEGGSSFLSLFGSPKGDEKGNENSKDQFSGFSTPFSGSGDAHMGSSSLLSLFGSPQASTNEKGDDNNFSFKFGAGDNTKTKKSFKLF